MKTKLSIIIVNYNTKKFITHCLESIYKEHRALLGRGIYEIIVVDNASTDDSVKFIKKNFPGVQVLVNKENTGFSAANNRGIKKSTGTYVLLLNPDTIVYQKTLPRVVSYMEKNPDVGIATCKVILPNGQLDDACHRGFPTPWRALTHFTGLGKLFPFSMFFNGYHLGYQDLTKIHEIDACAGAFLLIRRDIGEKVGWLDEDYFWYGEDLDLCYKVKQRGAHIVYIPDVSLLHYKGISSGIKAHSAHLSSADVATKTRATEARFAVMRIFYNKHYKNQYPAWLTHLVFFGISFKKKLTQYI